MGLAAYITRDVGITYYDDFEQYQAKCRYETYLPDRAEDVKMAIYNNLLSKTYFCSYVLEDDELNELIEKVIEEKYTRTDSAGNTEVIFDEYYGVQVKDIDDLNSYELDNFPHGLRFDAVINESVEDYYVLYYDPANTGTRSTALLYDKDTNRELDYYRATVR